MLFSLETKAVLGVGKPYFSNSNAVVHLLSHVSIDALVLIINACEF